ncbi:hypothetical protein NHH73_28825 [Oxalobacteraceae bacterium OTU3CINTB1]|nr:hypothetical protein NHH73_28825 [Oxalobacteraceae bacterium OTU3CINTB1]
MPFQSIRNTGARRRFIAAAIAALFTSLPSWAAEPHAKAAEQQRASLYTVINLGPEFASAVLNERGQVAFSGFNAGDTVARFFDGERLVPIGPADAFTTVTGLNDRGVVAGGTRYAGEADGRAFSWTAAGGIRVLPGAAPSTALDINERNEIVGWVSAPGVVARAIRWNPDGSTTLLGPLPASSSEGTAINDRGYATGYTTVANGAIHAHATFWDRAGAQTDLGPFDGGDGFGLRINERNEVAGVVNYPATGRTEGFFWSRDSGTVRIDAGPGFFLGDINNRGEIVASAEIGGRPRGLYWTLRRGIVPLQLGFGNISQAYDINDRGEIVGAVAAAEGAAWRAALWPSYSAVPIDLNTQLYGVPAGLEVRAAFRINERGDILADSNAGLVLLRPGRRGTDAPVLGPIIGLPAMVELGQDLTMTLNFSDSNATQTHTASAVWSDGCPSLSSSVSEGGGSGRLRLQHSFCAAGYYSVKVVVTDAGGRSTETWRNFLVVSPTLAALSGEGALAADAAGVAGAAAAGSGSGQRNAPLRFALWVPLGDAPAAAGRPVVRLSGPFQFDGESVTHASATGEQARVEGTGRLNGRAGYRFVLEAVDGAAGQDRLRVRVTHADAAGAEVVDYDNGAPGAAAGDRRAAVAQGGLTLRR